MTTPITAFPITGYTISDLALVSAAAGQFLEVGGSSDGRVDIDDLAAYCRAGLAWSDLTAKPTTLAGYGITDAQPLDADLTALAGLATTGAVERTGAGTAATFTVSAFAKTILDDTDAATARGTLGLGTIATQAANSVAITGGSITGITDLAIADGGTGASTQQAAINALAGSTTSGQYLRGNGTNVVMSSIQAADVPTLNQNTTGTAANVTGTVAVANGGTGATTAEAARSNLGVAAFEAGTWTPVIFGLTTAGTGTYTTQAGTYVRVGNLWTLNFLVTWTAHTGTGSLRIRGLPLTVPSGVATRGAAAISAANLNMPANTMLGIRGNQGADELFVTALPVGGGSASQFALPSTGSIEGSISLMV